MNRSRIVCALAAGLLFLYAAARGDSAYTGPDKTRSASGQFLVSSFLATPWYYRRPDAGTNEDIIHLDAPLLAVSAERFKASLWRQIGMPPDSSWSGKCFLNLHPARSTDDEVIIALDPFIRVWNYRLDLPDLIHRNRYARAMSAVLLLEIANRNAPVTGNSAVVPAWLADGLARQIVEADGDQVILSAPTKSVVLATPTKTASSLPMTRLSETRHGIDPLAAARRVLQSSPALTFEQLGWPSDAQLTGADGGVYLASAQLFASRLLKLPGGEERMREMLARLPGCENWQTAFYAAFRENFNRPLDVEKWWSLQVVNFANRDPGPRWMVAVGRQKLDALLLVPVDIRYQTNAWPVHADISLQSALRQVDPDQLTEILQVKLRDLELAQLRLTPQLAGLAAGYRAVLADFLGERKPAAGAHPVPKRSAPRWFKASAEATIAKLDALDVQRGKIEVQLEGREFQLPGN
jgi:hypothetical protein